MKSSHWAIVLLAVGYVVGLLVGAGVLARNAEAQVPVGLTPQRFQISAWGFVGEGAARQPERGCYIVDTATGELWYSINYANPKKISEKLR